MTAALLFIMGEKGDNSTSGILYSSENDPQLHLTGINLSIIKMKISRSQKTICTQFIFLREKIKQNQITYLLRPVFIKRIINTEPSIGWDVQGSGEDRIERAHRRMQIMVVTLFGACMVGSGIRVLKCLNKLYN